MNACVRRSKKTDIAVVAANMREADKREIWRSHRSTPEQSLSLGLKGDTCLTFCVDDEPVAMFGVNRTSALSGKGIPWFLGTEGVRKAVRFFLRQSVRHVEAMNQLYPVLENYVDKDNALSIRWLKWLGFDLKEEIQSPYGYTFIRFVRKHHV